MEDLIEQMNTYYPLTAATKLAFLGICHEESFKKNQFLLTAGTLARYIYFIRKGLVGYYTTDAQGNMIYKLFFAEKSFVASTASMIKNTPSDFNAIALEDCEVVKFSASAYRNLYHQYHDLALFHLNYLEQNWVVKKEPLEISLKHMTAKERYRELLKDEQLQGRLKQHQIASYLGVTPTQLSRIRKELAL